MERLNIFGEKRLGSLGPANLTRHSRNQLGPGHWKIRNPNIEIRNKFEIQMFKKSKPGKNN